MDDSIEVRRRSYPHVCRWFAALVLPLPLMLPAGSATHGPPSGYAWLHPWPLSTVRVTR